MGGSIARSRVGRWWTRTTAPGLVEWAILAVLLLLSYAVFLYGDVRATFEHSFNFLDAVLSGHPRNFYTLSIEHTSTGHPAVYDIPLYAIFGIWNLPTYVIHRITGFDYLNSTPAELWLKTMMVVAAFAAARVLAGLAEDLGVDRARTRWVAFFFLSSMAVFMPVFVVVQYDIILVLVMLLGLRAYVRGDLKAFLGWFLLANTLKLFALFVFIPLVLLREKRIRVAGAQLVVGLIGLALCRALYHGDPGYAAATSGFTDGMMSRLIATGIGWIGGSAPLMTIPFFVVFMVGLVIYSYAVRPEDRNERNVLAVYLCMAVYLVFMVIVPLNPYWIALLAPFIVLIVFLSPRHLLLNSVLEVVITGGIVLLYTRVGYSMYTHSIFEQLLLPHITAGAAQPRFATPQDVMVAVGLGGGNAFIIGAIIAAALAFLVLNYPRRSMIPMIGNTERVPRSVVWFRLAAPAAFAALLLVTYFVPAVPVVYSTAGGQAVSASENLLSEGAGVSETLTLDTTTDVSSIALGFQASSVPWLDSSSVIITIMDASGAEVFRTTVPANTLGDGLTELSTGGLTMVAHQAYTVHLSSIDTEGGEAYVQLNPTVDLNPTVINGRTVQGDLVMVLSGARR
ncbi:membrane protein [Actinomyces urogenitalis S6-C4]|nr:membrane protein [Actinomyces urogenitalis S6-C4]